MMKCDRCRKKKEKLNYIVVEATGVERFSVSVCDQCKKSFNETIPKALYKWRHGALYIKDEKLFLANEGTYGGILR